MPQEVEEAMTGWSSKVVVLGLGLGFSLVPMLGFAAPDKEAQTSDAGEGITLQSVPGLVIWVDPKVSDGERVGGWVEERGAQVLRKHEPQLEPEDLIHVTVKGGAYDYQIHVALLRERHLLPDQPDVLVCECGSDEMLDRVGEAIDAGARRLTDAAAAERDAEDQLQGKLPVQPQLPDDAKKKRQRLGALGYGGIGVSVLGAGVMGAGIALALRPDELRGDPGTLSTYTTRPPGIGLSVGGGVALAAGITLIVVDAVRHRKSRVALMPTVGSRMVVLSIARRF